MQEKLNIAVFVDYDNIEIGVKSTLRREFDVSLALDALKERGDLVAKFAYANWGRQEGAARSMAENAVQMVQRLPSPRGDKNGGDINLALDALEMAFTHSHVNAFAIISGDSDFIPLVNKLKEYGKTVFVVGGIIPDQDVEGLKKAGVAGIFQPGTPMDDIVKFIRERGKLKGAAPLPPLVY